MIDNALPVEGIFVDISQEVYYEGYGYDFENLGMGITALDGVYDIGISAEDVGDEVGVSPFALEDDSRLLPLIEAYQNTDGEWELGMTRFVEVSDIAANYAANISVMELNTLVQGYVLNQDSQPVTGQISFDSEISSEIDSEMNPIYIVGHSDINEHGYYSFWALNGEQLNIQVSIDGGPFVEESFLLDASTFDETLNAFIYNYNPNLAAPQQIAVVTGSVYSSSDEGVMLLPGVEVKIFNNTDLYMTTTTENGSYSINVSAPASYFVSATNNSPGFTNNDFMQEIMVVVDDYKEVDIEFFSVMDYKMISGSVKDDTGQPIYDAIVDISAAGPQEESGWEDYTYTDLDGYYSMNVPSGVYDINVTADGFFSENAYDVDVNEDVTLDFILEPASGFTGSVQGVVSFSGAPSQAYVNVYNNTYDVSTVSNEDGFYSIELIDGVYDIYVDASGYNDYIRENAFEVMGNTVVYDVELFEIGFAGAPHMVDLHDVQNDQGRQMRAVWDAGMPGDWGNFAQYSIWRKVHNAPFDLWDYIETVPWHGMDPYAAVVPTLGDSSAQEMHTSTFMVTAHTSDISVWLDSEPMSGYSVDNLHPGAPMSLSFSSSQSEVSLSWSASVDEDFSYFNIYRQDLLSMAPAVVFTSIDSFYTDIEVSSVGSYEYWITAVDLSGLESEASGFVSAVLSSEEEMGMPTNFALKQNYPNPFNPSTQIQYSLPSESKVLISIYDLTGRKVKTLVNDVQSAGYRTVMWNATNEIGRPVSAGMYIYSIQAGNFTQNRKMVLMK